MTVAEMERFTDQREATAPDQLWSLEHNPVFTQGTSCQDQPAPNPDNIPVVHSNRGGQITYHGPGQLIVYTLLDIKRLGFGPKKLVNLVEQSLLDFLHQHELDGHRLDGAPGVYLGGEKIAALGLRIRRGKCFHGLSLNVDMDMTPFDWIAPCGLEGMQVTQLVDHGVDLTVAQTGKAINEILLARLGLSASA